MGLDFEPGAPVLRLGWGLSPAAPGSWEGGVWVSPLAWGWCHGTGTGMALGMLPGAGGHSRAWWLSQEPQESQTERQKFILVWNEGSGSKPSAVIRWAL